MRGCCAATGTPSRSRPRSCRPPLSDPWSAAFDTCRVPRWSCCSSPPCSATPCRRCRGRRPQAVGRGGPGARPRIRRTASRRGCRTGRVPAPACARRDLSADPGAFPPRSAPRGSRHADGRGRGSTGRGRSPDVGGGAGVTIRRSPGCGTPPARWRRRRRRRSPSSCYAGPRRCWVSSRRRSGVVGGGPGAAACRKWPRRRRVRKRCLPGSTRPRSTLRCAWRSSVHSLFRTALPSSSHWRRSVLPRTCGSGPPIGC